MYNLIEYSDNYSKTSGSLWQYYKDDPNDNITQSESFKSKIKITGKTPAAGNTKDVEIIVPLKYLSNFWRTLEKPLIDCEVNIILTRLSTCVITNFTKAGRFAITDTKLYAPFVTLSTQDNTKQLQQLKSGFKEQLIGTNINQIQRRMHKTNIWITWLIEFFKEWIDFLYYLLKMKTTEDHIQIIIFQKFKRL